MNFYNQLNLDYSYFKRKKPPKLNLKTSLRCLQHNQTSNKYQLLNRIMNKKFYMFYTDLMLKPIHVHKFIK